MAASQHEAGRQTTGSVNDLARHAGLAGSCEGKNTVGKSERERRQPRQRRRPPGRTLLPTRQAEQTPLPHKASGTRLRASRVLERFETKMPYTLYNLYGSPPCATVRMLAKHIGVDLELKDVDTFKKEQFTPEYLKLNPFHRIPTFSDDGFIIYESTAICYYLLRKHAPDSELYPNCNRARARIDQALATITSTIQPHYFKFMKPLFYELKKPTSEDLREFEENVIKGFEQVLGDGNYVLGDKLSLADLSLVAHLTLVVELPLLEAQTSQKLKSYYERLKTELPYFDEVNETGISSLKTLATQLK